MKLTVIPIVIGTLGKIPKEMVKVPNDLEIWRWVKTIHSTALLKSVKILRWLLESWEDFLRFKLQGKTISLKLQ